jgi:hypothetical protein
MRVVFDWEKPATIPKPTQIATTINATRHAIDRRASGRRASCATAGAEAEGRAEPFWARRN